MQRPAVSYVLRVIEHLEEDMTYKRMTEADRRHIRDRMLVLDRA